ncbi:MAG: dihydroorotate dehydrogenase (quinone), partial [Planctomycetota bacterium]
LFERLRGQIPIVGVGGIFSGRDAWNMISAGAALVQTYTGFIYSGPTLARDVNRYLLGQLEQHRMKNISEAVGRDCQ